MANITITVNIDYMFSPENGHGHKCAVCDDQIYNYGFRLVVVYKVKPDQLPKFKETNQIWCKSCKSEQETQWEQAN